MILLNKEEATKIDAYIFEHIGIPRSVVVERAGLAVAKCCLRLLSHSEFSQYTINVFAGKGMNGADAMVCARELYSCGFMVKIWEVFPQNNKKNDLTWIRHSCLQLGIDMGIASTFSQEGKSIIVDGIFGTSFNINRDLDTELLDVFRTISKSQKMGSVIVSIDIPSGVDCDSAQAADYALTANETVTFIACKRGIIGFPGRKHAGNITIDQLGMPCDLIETANIQHDEFQAITLSDIAQVLPNRSVDGYKGLFGKVGIMGGSLGMAGAVCLCALASMKMGAGLVYLIVPDNIIGMCLEKIPEAIVVPALEQLPARPDVMIAGPGGVHDDNTQETIYQLIASYPKLILDAQALNILATDTSRAIAAFQSRLLLKLPLPILTPHPGEMNRLMPDDQGLSRTDTATAAAQLYQSVVVLKGAGTVIAHPDGRVWINTSGNSSMAKGGSGDILAGIIGAMMAQHMTPENAAIFGVYFHGLCGDLARAQVGEYSAMPSDTIHMIPASFKVIQEYNKTPYNNTFNNKTPYNNTFNKNTLNNNAFNNKMIHDETDTHSIQIGVDR